MSNKYNGKKFRLLAINSNDTKKMIDVFRSKHPVQYDLLTAGKDVEHDYGVSSFPTVVLINKEGKVIFSGGFDEQKLETLIDQNI